MHGNLLLFDFSKIGPLERLGLLKTQKLETQKQIKRKSTKFKSRVVKKKGLRNIKRIGYWGVSFQKCTECVGYNTHEQWYAHIFKRLSDVNSLKPTVWRRKGFWFQTNTSYIHCSTWTIQWTLPLTYIQSQYWIFEWRKPKQNWVELSHISLQSQQNPLISV